MALDDEDRIDIIATLHDRFSKTSDEFIRKLNEIERSADDTGESLDDLQDSLDEESKSTKESTQTHEQNARARQRTSRAIDDVASSLRKGTSAMDANRKATEGALDPAQRLTEILKDTVAQLEDFQKSTKRAADYTDDFAEGTERLAKGTKSVASNTERARDSLGRFTSTVKDGTTAVDDNTRATERNADITKKSGATRDRDSRAWAKWGRQINRITAGASANLQKFTGFFGNYFKVLSIFRGLLTSDLTAMIVPLVSVIKALGVAAAGSLAPLGRLVGALGQIVPLMAAVGQMKAVTTLAFKGVGEALKVLNDPNATPQKIAEAMQAAGQHGWEFAKSLKRIQDEFKPIEESVKAAFLNGLGPALENLAGTLFPLLNKELTRTADIMNGRLKVGLEGFASPGTQGTLASVMERSATASGLFVDILFSLVDVFLEVADAAGPSFIRTLESINGGLDRLTQWMRDHKDEMTAFFDRAGVTAGGFVVGLWNIVRGLYGIAQAAKPVEDFLFGNLGGSLSDWADRMNDPAKQAEMTENFKKMIPVLDSLGRVIGAVFDALGELGDSPNAVALLDELSSTGIPTMVDFFKAIDENVTPAITRISQALGGLDDENKLAFFQPLGDMLGGLATALEIAVPLFDKLPDPLQKLVFYGAGLAALGLPSLFALIFSPLRLVVNYLLMLTTGKTMGGWFTSFIGWVKDLAVKWLPKIGNFFKGIGAFLAPVLKPIIELAQKWFPKIFGFLAKKVAGKGLLSLIPVVGTVIAAVWTLWDVLSWLWQNSEGFRDFVGGIWEWIKSAWSASIDWIVNTVVPLIQGAWDKLVEGLKAVGDWFVGIWRDYIKPFFDGIVNFGKLLFVIVGTLIITPFVILWNVIGPILTKLYEWFMDGLPIALSILGKVFSAIWDGIKTVVTVVVGIIVYLALQVARIWTDLLAPALSWLGGLFASVWNGIKGAIDAVVAWFRDTAVPAFEYAIAWIAHAFDLMRAKVAYVWAWIQFYVIAPVIAWFQTYVWPVIANIIDWIKGKFTEFKTTATDVWGWIKNVVINPVIQWFMTYMWPTISNVINWIKDKWTDLKNKVSEVWSAIRGAISDAWHSHIDPIFAKISAAVEAMKRSFVLAKDSITTSFNAIREAARGPAQFIVDTVYNDGIRKVWNQLAEFIGLKNKLLPTVSFYGGGGNASSSTGGGSKTTARAASYDTGGWTGPGSKYKEAGIVHADEFVIRKSSQMDLRRAAPGFLDMLNRYGSRALSMLNVPGYAGGGAVKDTTVKVGSGSTQKSGNVVTNAIGAIVDGDVTKMLMDPFGGLADALTGQFRSKFSSNPWAEAGIEMTKQMIGGAKDYMAQRLIPSVPGGSGPGATAGQVASLASAGVGWARADAAARATGNRVTSASRPGARTAGSGAVSLHALGRARDYAGGNMSAFFDLMDRAPFPTELLHSPKGARNIHRGGKRGPNTGATLRNHYNHVHVGFWKGGLAGVDHMRYMGGPVETWGNTLVGEFGPEMFLPANGGLPSILGAGGPEVRAFDREGMVVPAGITEGYAMQLAHAAQENRGGDHIEFHFGNEVNGQTRAEIKAIVKTALKEIERNKKERS